MPRCLNCAQLPSWINNKLANVDFSAMLRKFASNSASKFWMHTVWFFVMIPIVSHQSIVMLPLTNFNTSPVCSTIETPAGMNSQTTMCLAKWAMAGLPYGIPMCFVGFICLVVGTLLSAMAQGVTPEEIRSELERGARGRSTTSATDRDDRHKGFELVLGLLGVSIYFTGLVLVITGICMLLFWLLGGVFLGFYFTFSSATVLEDLALVKLFGVVSTALATTISTLVI